MTASIRKDARRAASWKHGDPAFLRFMPFRGASSSSRKNQDEEIGNNNAAPVINGAEYTLSPTQTGTARGDALQDEEDTKGVTLSTHDSDKPQVRSRRNPLRRLLNRDGASPARVSSKTRERHFGVWEQIKVVIFGSWINVLLVCVPAGIALHVADVNPYAAFAVNFVAIIPLAGILSFATEEIALRVGETLGGLLNASFGNAVELIVSVIALTKNQIIIVQTSLIGSILSNLLLVLGMCFFFGGAKRIEQFFNVTVANTAASLLALAVGSLLIPTCFLRFGTGGTYEDRQSQIAKLSRGESIILLLVYLSYLFFQLKSHSAMFSETGGAATERKPKKDEQGATSKAIGAIGANNAAHAGTVNNEIFRPDDSTEDDDEEENKLSAVGAVLALCISTALVGVNSDFMVDGITVVADVISPEFIGLILIPIVGEYSHLLTDPGNAAEHATAVTVAIKDKMDLAIGVAVGSSMQIALLILPLIVIIGWILGKNDMTLEFDGFLLTVVFVAVLLVNYLISDGRSHWLEGIMLMMLYVIIAVAAYLYPAAAEDVVG